MKKTVLVTLLAASALYGAETKKTKPAPVVTIPAEAVKDGNHYRYVDKDGKTWIYKETPFGVTKRPETAADTAGDKPVADRTGNVKAVREGDTIHFTKPNPFGEAKWDKNVNDLTPEEQKVWEREQAKRNQ